MADAETHYRGNTEEETAALLDDIIALKGGAKLSFDDGTPIDPALVIHGGDIGNHWREPWNVLLGERAGSRGRQQSPNRQSTSYTAAGLLDDGPLIILITASSNENNAPGKRADGEQGRGGGCCSQHQNRLS